MNISREFRNIKRYLREVREDYLDIYSETGSCSLAVMATIEALLNPIAHRFDKIIRPLCFSRVRKEEAEHRARSEAAALSEYRRFQKHNHYADFERQESHIDAYIMHQVFG